MSKIKMSELKEMIAEVLNEEETAYQKFFKSALDKFGVNSPAELEGDKKKEFFNWIELNWKGEKNETLEPVSPANGNPLKRVKAKKRDQILAAENFVRKLVREELKFVMYNEIEPGVSRKRAKKRITQSGSSKSTSSL